jgi:hypothetical protein
MARFPHSPVPRVRAAHASTPEARRISSSNLRLPIGKPLNGRRISDGGMQAAAGVGVAARVTTRLLPPTGRGFETDVFGPGAVQLLTGRRAADAGGLKRRAATTCCWPVAIAVTGGAPRPSHWFGAARIPRDGLVDVFAPTYRSELARCWTQRHAPVGSVSQTIPIVIGSRRWRP